MFAFRKEKKAAFDPAGKTPVLRASICTGERVAGYRDDATGRFTELTVIRSDADLDRFFRTYGFRRDALRREW